MATCVEESVDALCDMFIVTLNSFDIEELGTASNGFLYNLLIEVNQGVTPPADLLATLWESIKGFGYAPELAVFEAILEISSRKQDPKQAEEWAVSGAVGKWRKDKNQPKDTLYIANYNNARIPE